ncbi:uncharacterized protein LTR77_004433 [Saxophila tyrrhenica]|uniref:Uncharacterized protein n=1 Tax=Saxophila tyrrhenica TaxID=1690608 RepID=A0AAV9PCP6_9PEZI|nr:hypothetical protein LTR77_004433 [Saxophila tyrrhenica]
MTDIVLALEAAVFVHSMRSDKPTTHNKRRLHKLDADVPIHDVRPPEGVPHARLDSVQLEIAVSGLPEVQAASAEDSSTSEAEGATGPDPTEFEHELLLDESRSMLDDHELLMDGIEGGQSETGSVGRDFKDCTAQALTDWTLMCVHIAIAGPASRRVKDLAISTASLQPLASIAPSIWSPRYLPSLAARSVFLPTISHALASVVRTSKSKKIERLASNVVEAASSKDRITDHSHPQSATSTRFQSSVFHKQLWKMLQTRMYDPKAAKRPQLLVTPTTVSSTVSNDMLELDADADGLCDTVDLDHDMLTLASDNENDYLSEDDILGIDDFEDFTTTAFEDAMDSEELEMSSGDQSTQTTVSSATTDLTSDEDLLSVYSSIDSMLLLGYDEEEEMQGCRWQDAEQMLCI